MKILQKDFSKAFCFLTSSFDERESKIQRTQATFQAIDVAVVCTFKQFKKSTFKTISWALTCESFAFRIAFLYPRCNHTKTWKLHDKNANKKKQCCLSNELNRISTCRINIVVKRFKTWIDQDLKSRWADFQRASRRVVSI